jgi:hypothetical protein
MLLCHPFCPALFYIWVHLRGPSLVVIDAAIETVRDHVDGSTAKCHSGSDRQYVNKRLRIIRSCFFPFPDNSLWLLHLQ